MEEFIVINSSLTELEKTLMFILFAVIVFELLKYLWKRSQKWTIPPEWNIEFVQGKPTLVNSRRKNNGKT